MQILRVEVSMTLFIAWTLHGHMDTIHTHYSPHVFALIVVVACCCVRRQIQLNVPNLQGKTLLLNFLFYTTLPHAFLKTPLFLNNISIPPHLDQFTLAVENHYYSKQGYCFRDDHLDLGQIE